MDINSSNIAASSAQQISRINLNTATRAFEASKASKNDETAQVEDFKQEDINLMETRKTRPAINVAEIQQYASSMGETLTIDDINYGLMYGRSVIADYSA